jgi:glycine cleavage system pyridoxal-binding protein P
MWNIFHRSMSTFSRRHIGVNNYDVTDMLKVCNTPSITELIKEVIPDHIEHKLKPFDAISEEKALNNIEGTSEQITNISNFT